MRTFTIVPALLLLATPAGLRSGCGVDETTTWARTHCWGGVTLTPEQDAACREYHERNGTNYDNIRRLNPVVILVPPSREELHGERRQIIWGEAKRWEGGGR